MKEVSLEVKDGHSFFGLEVNGRKMHFSDEELIAILEKHFSNEEQPIQIVEMPVEGKLFEIKPVKINRSLFSEKRDNEEQEKLRKLILQAFERVNNEPKKYCRTFYTYKPKKMWDKPQHVSQLRKMACKMGDHLTDWVEFALEQAQRIQNGESWEILCNIPDSLNYNRLIVWKDGTYRIVGGAVKMGDMKSPSYIFGFEYESNCVLESVVPSVTSFKIMKVADAN